MKTTNTFGIRFFIKNNLIKDGEAPIYSRITVDGTRVDISLKRKINVHDWNPVLGSAKGSKESSKSLNHYLKELESRIIQIYQEFQIKKNPISADAIKHELLGTETKEHTISMLFEYHNEKYRNVLAWGTLKNYFTTQKYVMAFAKSQYGKDDFFLQDINYRFLNEFELYLINYEPQDHHKRLSNNGIMKHLERFRKVINLALRMEWMVKDPFAKFSLRYQKVEREYLTPAELKQIEKKKFDIPRLSYIRDLFVFACYTGLSYIDTVNLKNHDVIIGIDEEYWISISRQKTQQKSNVPLLPQALDIIRKYMDPDRAYAKGKIFPLISNQKLNAYLKEISIICNIKKNMTFHLARHTFATTVTLLNGVPIETVSKMLGHASLKTTQVYAKVVEQKVSNDMKELRRKLGNSK
ncbi:Site-specific recombinase XerD [Algoriphagus locisalis]|uniref:Site-specific recombinase XerD n=1 Tax=Algoriphagus locisalis TaxID=305507 RepID=A0A1I7DR62_9BACT|nr:site-specific integrase [Algoriphagus locisalis]SFU14153.1 Site-specific recombinase XerD [Algoriphagus locisalis]